VGLAAVICEALVGRAVALPPDLARQYPELAAARYRRGGLPVRIGGWCLGQPTVDAITLWGTIWLAPEVPVAADLLLHEVRHVQQFETSPAFPVRYLWESLRRGYHRNRYEADARAYSRARLAAGPTDHPRGDA
jgi:hypothetical protein